MVNRIARALGVSLSTSRGVIFRGHSISSRVHQDRWQTVLATMPSTVCLK